MVLFNIKDVLHSPVQMSVATYLCPDCVNVSSILISRSMTILKTSLDSCTHVNPKLACGNIYITNTMRAAFNLNTCKVSWYMSITIKQIKLSSTLYRFWRNSLGKPHSFKIKSRTIVDIGCGELRSVAKQGSADRGIVTQITPFMTLGFSVP